MTPGSSPNQSEATRRRRTRDLKLIAKRAGSFLAARWWAGVGVLIAVVAVVWAIWSTTRTPANPLARELSYLHELDPDDPRSYLIVETARTHSVTEPIETYRSVVLKDDAVLRIVESSWSLSALSIEFGTNVRIDAHGDPGQDGSPGNNGNSGPRCGDGTDGEPGSAGTGGLRGRNIVIKTLDLRLPPGGVHVDTSGGRGGNGGQGGNGGRGGRGSRNDRCGGGNGGQGGKGGDAGIGGVAGDFTLQYLEAAAAEGERTARINHDRVIASISHNRAGGLPGSLGEGGNGGPGGYGRGASLLHFDSQPAGSPGSGGANGEPAQNGPDGRTSIEIVQ